jgi:hypothetical protein
MQIGTQPVVKTPVHASIDYGTTITILNDTFSPIDAVMLMRQAALPER